MNRLRWWRGGVFDLLVLGVAVAAELEILVRDLPGPRWLLTAAAVLYTLPLLLRARWPFAAPAVAIAVQVLASLLDVPGGQRENWGVVAYVLAFWVFGAHNRLRVALAGLGLALAGVVVVTVEDARVPADDASSVALVGSLTWLAGAVLRQRGLRAAEAEARAADLERGHREAELAVTEERARIARELHDVVAHSVSVMTVQAGAARMLLGSDPQRAVGPLMAVEESGRQALAELRRLLGVLRADHVGSGLTPQPGMDELPGLADTMREAGLPVELVVAGEVRPLAPGLGLAAYRIVQEALTNALKHANAQRVQIRIGYGVNLLDIEICDDGRGPPPDAAGRPGHGIAGMRERAALYGGVLESGPGPGGGYAVRARLPIEQAAP